MHSHKERSLSFLMAIVSVNVVVFGGCGILHATVPRPKGGTVDDLIEGSRGICIWRVYTWFSQYHASIIKSSYGLTGLVITCVVISCNCTPLCLQSTMHSQAQNLKST